MRGADWVTGVSQAVVDDTLAYAPFLAPRISLIYNGVFPLEAPPRGADSGPRLLCIGRLVPEKGFDLAIEAVARLARSRPTLRLSIGGDGVEAQSLRRQAAALGIDDSVDFLGLVDRRRVGELMGRATALLMPSRVEGLPLVALEAAWARLPIVGARVPGVDEAVLDGSTGLLVDPEDPTALADGVDRVLADPKRAAALASAARARVEREFSLAACARNYEAIYRQLMVRRARSSPG
jgi:glycogen(starch) synthase